MSGLTNSLTRTTEKSIHKIGFVVSAFTNYMRHKSIYNADPVLTAKHRKVINAMIAADAMGELRKNNKFIKEPRG